MRKLSKDDLLSDGLTKARENEGESGVCNEFYFDPKKAKLS